MKRFRALLFRNRAEQELDDELALHLEMETRKNLAAGMAPEQAARAARLHFGTDPGAVKDYVRDTHGIGFLETLLHDIRYALRGFRRAPPFALTVIGTIAIGLGWNTAAFTLFNAAFLRPIDARDPYSLYAFGWQDRTGNGTPVTWRQLDELRQQRPGLAAITATHSLRSGWTAGSRGAHWSTVNSSTCWELMQPWAGRCFRTITAPPDRTPPWV